MGFFDQMKQLNELKSKMDEMKLKLNDIAVSEENEALKITVNGHRKITNIIIREKDLIEEESLKRLLNTVLEKADAVIQKEMMGSLPNISGF